MRMCLLRTTEDAVGYEEVVAYCNERVQWPGGG